MSRFESGWIKTYRALYSKFYGDCHGGFIFGLLISWANYEDATIYVKRQKILLKRGQLITSEREIAKAAGCSRKIVRRVLVGLAMEHAIAPLKGPHGTVITICNYDEYQSVSDDKGPLEAPPEGPLRDHLGPYNKELKNKTSKEEDNIIQIADAPLVSQEVKKVKPKKETDEALEVRRVCWDIYSKGIKNIYNVEIESNAERRGLIKKLNEKFGDLLPDLLSYYLSRQDKEFKGHSLRTLSLKADLLEIGLKQFIAKKTNNREF